jgi:hypothetical protein
MKVGTQARISVCVATALSNVFFVVGMIAGEDGLKTDRTTPQAA